MWGILLCGLATAGTKSQVQNAGGVPIVDLSNFAISIGEAFGPSEYKSKPGLYVVRDLGLPAPLMRTCASDIAGLHVRRVFRVNSEEQVEAWDATGNRTSTFGIDAKAKATGFFVELEYIGDLRTPYMAPVETDVRPYQDRRTHQWVAGGDTVQDAVPRLTQVQIYGDLPEFIDFRTTIERVEEVGSIPLDLDKSTLVDGQKFTLHSMMDSVADKAFNDYEVHFKFSQEPKLSNPTYDYLPRVDWPKFQEATKNRHIPICFVHGGPAEWIADKPSKYWKDITVLRHTKFDCVLTHIPTKPRQNP